MVKTGTTRDKLRARFDKLLDAAGVGELEAARLRAGFAQLLGEVDGWDWQPLELGAWQFDLDDWTFPDLPTWDFDDLAKIQEQDAAQLDALTRPTHCPSCGQPMPKPSEPGK